MEEKCIEKQDTESFTRASSEIPRSVQDFRECAESNDDEKPYEGSAVTRLTTNRSTRSVQSTVSRAASAFADPTAHIQDPGPPPDGGLKAWTQVLMGHFIMITTWGYISSYGVFQTYYESTLSVSGSAISWVGSVQFCLIFALGTFTGRALDAGYFRLMLICGSILQLLGIFTTSACTKYWQLFLAQGICTGLGNGMQFMPTVGLVSTYFSKRKATAIAFMASGTATGGMIFPAMVRQLLPQIGFGWTVRVLGFVVLALVLTAIAFMQPRLPPRRSSAVIEWSAFKEAPFIVFILAMWLNFWGLFFAFFYVVTFGQDRLGLSYENGIDLLIIMNGVGFAGRVFLATVADRYIGPMNTLIPTTAICCLLTYCWAAVQQQAGLYAFACVYGLFAAGIQGLWPATLANLTTDLTKMGTRLGMGSTIVSVAILTGSPLGGALVSKDNGGYLYAQPSKESHASSNPISIHRATTAEDTNSIISFLASFVPVALPLTPNALPLIHRLQSPIRSSEALILSTFAPNESPSQTAHSSASGHPYTVAFFDRSTPDSLPMFLFSSVEIHAYSASDAENHEYDDLALRQLHTMLAYCHVHAPPGATMSSSDAFVSATRNQPPLKGDISFAGCVHSRAADLLRRADANSPHKIVRDDVTGKGGPYMKLVWRRDPSLPLPYAEAVSNLPQGLVWDHVRTDEDVARVMATNSLVRVRSQIDHRLNAALRDKTSGQLVGWVFVGLEGSVRTLFVEREWRRKGLARRLVAKLMETAERQGSRGEGKNEQAWRADSKSGRWWHTDVAEDNVESRGLCERCFGAKKAQESYWIRVDLEAATKRVWWWRDAREREGER
ncbi:MAG: hypothetical protein Q9162_006813 [Coniocarpon cinnabarinum]